MAAKSDFLYYVSVRGSNRVPKKRELLERVAAAPGCFIVRDMTMEGTCFIYSMDVTARTNPLQKYIGKSAKANIHVRPCPKGTLVADVAGRVISEGTPFERTVEDELSD